MKEYRLIANSDFTPKMWIYLEDAIKRHPDFAKTPHQAICIITEELGELCQAINDGNTKLARVELFHCIATLTRLYGMYLEYDALVNNAEKLLKGEKCTSKQD